MSYGGEQLDKLQYATQLPSARPITLKEQIEGERERAQLELARTDELLGLLERNPDLSRALELLGRKY